MATLRWIGNAAAVNDLKTVSLSGTVTSQTYTFTINSKTITYAAGGSDTVTIILAALTAAWNASTIPEAMEMTAAALPVGGPYTSMTLTGDVAGRPSTVSVGTSGGATFSIATTTAGTGPNDFANGQNWSGGSAPANNDTLVFDNGSIACKYNLGTSLTGITVSVEPGYSGAIGLPLINADGATQYAEYRTTSMTLTGGTVTVNSPTITRCNLAFGANTATVRILNSGQRPDPNVPVVLVIGGNSSSAIDITKGDVGIAYYAGTTATFPAVNSTFATNERGDVRLAIGTGATLTTVSKNGGSLVTNSNVTTLTQGPAGGSLIVAAGAVTTLNVQGGICNYNSTGTLGTPHVSNDGFLDFDQDSRPKTVTNTIQVYGDKAAVQDNQKVVNSGVLTVKANQTTTINVGHGSNNTMTFT